MRSPDGDAWHLTLRTAELGPLLLEADGDGLTAVRFAAAQEDRPGPLLPEAAAQLRAYLAGELRVFSLPLSMRGTAFQQAVWQALLRIPYGETRTYAEVAAMIGRPRAARAVGMACHVNPVAVIVPCHRVVGADGRLTGYAGGLDRKRLLLELEQGGRRPADDGSPAAFRRDPR